MNKSLLSERLTRERDRFEALLNHVGSSRRMAMRGVRGGLSVKDLLADVLTREQFICDRLNEIMLGVAYEAASTQTDLEAFRAQFGVPDYESPLVLREHADPLVVERHHGISLDEVVALELAAYSGALSAFSSLSHLQCLDHDVYHRMAEHTYRPYRRAAIDIRRWLRSIAGESL